MNSKLKKVMQLIFELKEENRELESTLCVLKKYNLSDLIEDEILNRIELNKVKIQTVTDYDSISPRINIKTTNDGLFQIRTKFTRIRITDSEMNRKIFEELQKLNNDFMLEFLINVNDRCKINKVLVESLNIEGDSKFLDKLTDLICKIKLDSDSIEDNGNEKVVKLNVF